MAAGALLACGHTPSAKLARILGQAQETNTRNEQAVLSRFLRAEHVTLLKPEVQWLSHTETSTDEMRPVGELQSHDGRQKVRVLMGEWDYFQSELEESGRAEVVTDSGRALLLVLPAEERWVDADHRYYARDERGRLLIIETRLRPILRHRLTKAGNCDGMPVFSTPSGWSVIVFEKLSATDFDKLRRVRLPFEGESISVGCESYVY